MPDEAINAPPDVAVRGRLTGEPGDDLFFVQLDTAAHRVLSSLTTGRSKIGWPSSGLLTQTRTFFSLLPKGKPAGSDRRAAWRD